MSGDLCGDNRFEVIDRAKKDLLMSTNIATSPKELVVIDTFLFRCWQMGWLTRYDDTIPLTKKIQVEKERIVSINLDEEGYMICKILPKE